MSNLRAVCHVGFYRKCIFNNSATSIDTRVCPSYEISTKNLQPLLIRIPQLALGREKPLPCKTPPRGIQTLDRSSTFFRAACIAYTAV